MSQIPVPFYLFPSYVDACDRNSIIPTHGNDWSFRLTTKLNISNLLFMSLAEMKCKYSLLTTKIVQLKLALFI